MSVTYPDDTVKQLISEGLHEAVQALGEENDVARIRLINTIGCFLLTHLTGTEYAPVSGAIEVRAGGEPFGLEASTPSEGKEHYVWIAGTDPDGALEFVDFGARYWPEWAQAEGVRWNAETTPTMVWGPHPEIPEDLAVYTLDDSLSADVCEALDEFINSETETIEAWEEAVNDAVDYLMETDEGVNFLVEAGIAEWGEDEDFEDEDNGAPQ